MAEINQSTPVDAAEHLAYSYFPIVVDVLIRWLAWTICRVFRWPDLALWMLQVVAVPLLVLIINSVREETVRKRAHVPTFAGYVAPMTAMRLSVCAGAVLLSVEMAYRHLANLFGWAQILLTVMVGVAYALYLAVLWPFSIRYDEYAAATPQLQELAIDENDRIIIKLGAKANSLKQRVDTYTLESALFGALAFSAFVTIVASEHRNLEGVKAFVNAIPRCLTLLARLQGVALWEQLGGIDDKKLLAVVAFDTLVCSLMFLAVIICRLRFTDLVVGVDYWIQIAQAFNDKEEDVHKITLQVPEREPELRQRLNHLTEQIGMAIQNARQALEALNPVVTYMSGFRRFGILGFLVVLVTSAMWVDPMLALLFASLGCVSILYPTVDGWIRDRKAHRSYLTPLIRVVDKARPSVLGP